MRVLVTGGAGYIGSVVADHLLRAGHTVTVLDNLIMGWREAVPAGAEFVHADVGDEAALDPFSPRASSMPSCISPRSSRRESRSRFPNSTSTTTLCARSRLLRVMLKHGVSRYVFSSTAAVYGEPKILPIPEDHPLAPTNAYGESKLIVEQMLAWFHRAHGFRYASLRYFNAAGATPARGEAHRSESHLIPLILQVPLGQREFISIFGSDYPTKDGTCMRDYIHVDDLASAHVLALNGLETHETLICNLGTGSGFSVREIVEIARKVTGHPIPVRELPRRAGDPAVLVASAEKARSLLGWTPRHSDVESIIQSAWQWHKSHPRGYRTA